MSSEKVDLRFVNPQTGPFYVEGAEPGDTLALHLVSLEPARDWGASAAIPFFGGLTSTDRTATLAGGVARHHLDLPPRLGRAHPASSKRGTASTRVDLPLEPMLGTVGVAPASNEVRSSLVPDRFGGNMDTPQMRAGTTCYLGVNVEGALFSIGDGHYRQGEGESCGTAVEGAMTTTLIVELIKGSAPGWPRLEDDDHIMTVGSSRPLEDAWRVSQVEMVTWLTELYGLHTDGRLPAALADLRDAARERRRRELQRRGQGSQGTATRRRPPSAGCTATCAPALPSSPAPNRGTQRPSPLHHRPERRSAWICNSPGGVPWSPAALAASAARSSNTSSPRARRSPSAPVTPTR